MFFHNLRCHCVAILIRHATSFAFPLLGQINLANSCDGECFIVVDNDGLSINVGIHPTGNSTDTVSEDIGKGFKAEQFVVP